MDILSILQSNEDIGHVPVEQLQWLIDNSTCKEFKVGDPLFIRGTESTHMFVMLSGRFRIWLGEANNTRELARIETGDITGVLPYSRSRNSIAFSAALEPSIVLHTHKDIFPQMIREKHELTTALVHVMSNRIRNFTTLQQQNEKLVSLGKLSAGLAHELNNPAAALVRTAQELKNHLSYLPDNFKNVMRIQISPDEVDTVNDLMYSKIAAGTVEEMSLMQRTEKEDDIRDWLEDNDLDDDDDLIDNLVEFGFTTDELDTVLEKCGEKDIAPVIRWIGNNLSTERMVEEIEDASKRISDLIGSIKSYSHMDQTTDRQLVNIHDGIKNTIMMLKHKFKKNNVQIVKDIDPDISKIYAYPGELNQIWTNIIDNALDAMENTGGTLTLRSGMDGPCVKIQIEDSGKGIPEDVKSRIFDPFFTTKPMGKGTGLGLDVVAKLVAHHRADISVDSEPGKTVFTFLFPVE
ncbi:MAG: ATP-binding protein [Bacteroidia bacterium]|nr:ATP-binding protein [Bacteroidia bacterium]